MDYKKRKKELEEQFNQFTQKIQELVTLREQIKGRYQEIEQLEKDANVDKPNKKHGNAQPTK